MFVCGGENIFPKEVEEVVETHEDVNEFDVGLVFHGSSVLADAREKLEAFVEFDAKP